MGAFSWFVGDVAVMKDYNERRVRYGKPDSVGDLSHQNQGKGKEMEKVNLDGLL